MRCILACVALVAAPVLAGAQTLGPGGAIPAVANLPGLGGTFWQSDVSIANLDPAPTTVTLTLLPEIRNGAQAFAPMMVTRSVPAGAQLTLTNIVQSVFDRPGEKGALLVNSQTGAPLVLASRTFTSATSGGTYGQDVYGVLVGGRGWVGGLRHDASYRTNIGVMLPALSQPGVPVEFTVTVRDAAGTEVAQGVLQLPAAGLLQKSLSAFGVDLLLDGQVEIGCSDPSLTWYAYASRVDQTTGDPVYRALRGLAADLP